MAKKYVRGYTIEDIKVGMKIKDKGDQNLYGIITDIEDVHNVEVTYYDKNGKRAGFGFYCFDKKCDYEYNGGHIEIITEIITE